MTKGNQRANYIKQISSIPPGDRADVIQNFLVLMKKVPKESNSPELLQALYLIPSQFRQAVVTKALPLMGKPSEYNVPTAILPTVYSLLLSKEENSIEQCLPLLKDIAILKEKAEVLIEFVKVPLEDREGLISICAPIFSILRWGNAELLKSIVRLPAENKDSIIKLTRTLLNNEGCGKAWAKFIDTIFQVPSDHRVDVVRRTAALKLKGEHFKCNNGEFLIKSIAAIPLEERDEVLDLAKPILKGINKNLARSDIINAIASMHPLERKNVISKSAHWLVGLDGRLIAPVLEAVYPIFPGATRVPPSTVRLFLARGQR